jgi:hypothetical protein
MPKSRAAARLSSEHKTPVQSVMDAADALFRAAAECCHQHDRVSRVHEKSAVEEEVQVAQRVCQECDEVLRSFMTAYEQAAADVQVTGKDEGWWHRANGLWLASREYLRRNVGCDAASRELTEHGPDRLGELHTEYELEASALLALRHAAEAYKRDRPSAA